ncbi:MAG: phosphotransferase family protein [Trebonia sp.]
MPDQFPADPDALADVVRGVFPRSSSVEVSPAADRRVVVVYRVVVDGVRYYLRLAEEPGQNLTTDALVLERLRALGVRVPEAVAAEPATTAFPRSWLLMTEVPGRSLAEGGTDDEATDDEATQAAIAAGRDVATINSVPVAGFGWVRRDGDERLTGELNSYGQFVTSYLPEPWPGQLSGLFHENQLDALHAIAKDERDRPLRGGYLAHGDLDVTHIYTHAGRYSGIIDFGEMRGTDPYFDLGHFMLHDGETRRARLFDSFLKGYLEVSSPPHGYREAIRSSAILLGLRQLSFWLTPERGLSIGAPLVRRRAAELSNLLAGKPAHRER